MNLQDLAKSEIGNRMASNSLKQARSGDNYKAHLKKAKELNFNLRPYNKNYLNMISKMFGIGNLEYFTFKCQ